RRPAPFLHDSGRPPMRIAVPRESASGETRVAIVPETVKRLVAKKIDVSVEAGAGTKAFIRDEDYTAAGAKIEPSQDALFASAAMVVKIHPPTKSEAAKLKEGSAIVSLLYPLTNVELVRALVGRKLTVLATDMIPRTTLAQSMDVLSSQTTAAGYHGVL